MKISKEFKVGLVFVVAIAALIWGFNFLKGKNIFTQDRLFYAVYGQIAGLTQANPVLINGLKVGQVSDLTFDQSMNGDIIVEVMISADFPIPNNSTLRIVSQDLMGSKAIEIILGDAMEQAADGDTLISSVEATLSESVNAQIAPLKAKAENLISSIDTMVVAIQGVFDKNIRSELLSSIKSIRKTFQNLETTTSNLDTLMYTQSSRIASIIYNLDLITGNLRENEDRINKIMANLSTVSDSLAHAPIGETFANLNSVVDNIHGIVAKIENGEGSLGMLVNDDQLYIELEKTALELNQLLEDVRVNPKRYVRFSLF